MSEPRKPARNPVVMRIFRMSPEERDSAYLSALYDGDSRRALMIARAPIPKDWPEAIRHMWFDRRGLSGVAARVDDAVAGRVLD